MKKSGVYKSIAMAVVISAFTLTHAASAANIGYVAGLTGGALDKPFDLAWSARLTSQGYTVTPIDQTTAANSPSLAGIDLFIVSQDVGSGTYLTGVGINQPKPILTYEYGIYDDIFGATGNGNSAGLLTNGITISNPSHPLAAGLSGNVSIYTGQGGNGNISRYTGYTTGSTGTQLIAVSADSPANNIFAVLPAGAAGAGGSTWSALRMTLPCYDDWDPAFVTANGWKLLDNAVAYSLIPEPSSLALIGLGMAMFLVRRQSR
jgi:hypothetical protein